MSTTPVSVEAIPPGHDAGIAEYVRIRCAVTPENPESVEQARWEDATYPGDVIRFLAVDLAGSAVGVATTGRIWMHPPSYERYWLGLWVLPEARERGIGSALYATVSEVARAAGKTGFQTELSEAQVDGHRWLTARGFVAVDRMKSVRLDLAGTERPAVAPPAGITLVSLADRPDLVVGVHRVALEAFPDVPTGDEPLYAGTLEEFVARDVDRFGVPRDGFWIALDEASGEVAGYANLVLKAGSTSVAWHDMTAVRPAYRGRGIAKALKRATIAWAVDHGLEALETGNEETNTPMRAVNQALGYQPLPDWIGLHGPLAPER